jgi:hypothetical protein
MTYAEEDDATLVTLHKPKRTSPVTCIEAAMQAVRNRRSNPFSTLD